MYKIFFVVQFLLLSLFVEAEIARPSKPDFENKRIYLSWYKNQVKERLCEDQEILSFGRDFSLSKLPKKELNCIVDHVISGSLVWHSSENKLVSKYIHEINRRIKRIKLTEKYDVLFDSSYERMIDIILPDIRGDTILVKCLLCAAFEDRFDESKYLDAIESSFEIAKYGQFGNYFLVEKVSTYWITDLLYESIIHVLDAGIMTNSGLVELEEIFSRFNNNSFFDNLAEAVCIEEAFFYDLLQSMCYEGEPKLSERAVLEDLTLFGIQDAKAKARKIAKEDPEFLSEQLTRHFDHLYRTIGEGDSKKSLKVIFKLASIRDKDSGYMKYFCYGNMSKIFLKAAQLDLKQTYIKSWLLTNQLGSREK